MEKGLVAVKIKERYEVLVSVTHKDGTLELRCASLYTFDKVERYIRTIAEDENTKAYSEVVLMKIGQGERIGHYILGAF